MNDDFFDNKKYVGKWTPIYYFAELGDTDNFFIELKYFINKTHYLKTKSDIGTALDFDMLDYDGIGVFAGIPETTLEVLKDRNYKLAFVSDGIEYNEDGDLLIVSETYSYAPNKLYISYENDIVPIWGLKDVGALGLSTVVFGRGNNCRTTIEEHTLLKVADVSKFSTGDKVSVLAKASFAKRGINNVLTGIVNETYELPTHNAATIVSIYELNRIIELDRALGDMSWSIGNTLHTSHSYKEIPDHCNECLWETISIDSKLNFENTNLNYRIHSMSVKKVDSSRPFKRRDRQTKTTTSFHSEYPNDVPKFLVPQLGDGSELDVISKSTTPSISQWKEYIKAEKLFVYTEPTIEYDEINKLYKMIVKETKCI